MYDVDPLGGAVQPRLTAVPETVAPKFAGASGSTAAGDTRTEILDNGAVGQLIDRPNDVFARHSHNTVVDAGTDGLNEVESAGVAGCAPDAADGRSGVVGLSQATDKATVANTTALIKTSRVEPFISSKVIALCTRRWMPCRSLMTLPNVRG
jgi:hypothetical protein